MLSTKRLKPTLMAVALASCTVAMLARAQGTPDKSLFRHDNLTAWCIVPFDGKKRGPEERVAMLKRLGFERYAYDWRVEHVPTFERELELLRANRIELAGVWFPATLTPDAKTILGLLEKHKVKTQLWVMLTDPAPKGDQQAKVDAAVNVLAPLAERAAKIDCKVGLYNHGSWFGEPENLVAVVEALKRANVGIVYNFHHGHDHLDRLAKVLPAMKPHLYAINLSGMITKGDRLGKKIMVLGQERDVEVLKTIRASGYQGQIGILGHTQDDVEERLRDNLDGLDWLLPQLDGKPAGARPKYRTEKR